MLKIQSLLFIYVIFLSNFLFAQQSPLIQNTFGRKTTSLNGKWSIIIDPYENGFYNYRYEESPTGYFKNKTAEGNELIEYKFDNGNTLQVPGDWNSQREELLWYEGTIWYKFSFDYPTSKNTRQFIYFGAANYETYVYLNGEKLGKHIGGFTPFQFEVTGKLKEKENFVVVKVDNKRYKEAIPTVNTDWWNYGGITRDVKIVEVPSSYIQDYFIQLEKGTTDRISGWVKLDAKEKVGTVQVEIPELGLKQNFKVDTSGVAKVDFKAKLSLWSPENPKLYKVIVRNEMDKVEDQIGFRSIVVKGSKYFT